MSQSQCSRRATASVSAPAVQQDLSACDPLRQAIAELGEGAGTPGNISQLAESYGNAAMLNLVEEHGGQAGGGDPPTAMISPRPEVGEGAGDGEDAQVQGPLDEAIQWLEERWDDLVEWWNEDEEQEGADQQPAQSPDAGPDGGTPAPAVCDTSWWEAYRAESSQGARQQLAFEACDQNRIDGLVGCLTQEQRQVTYLAQLQEVLDFVQLHATQRAAGTDLQGMGRTQAAYMTAQDEALAREETGGREPTEDELAEARAEREEQDYAPDADESTLQWPRMVQRDRDAWIARGVTAKATILAHIAANHPEFTVTEDQIVVDFEQVEAANAVAYATGTQCFVGFDVVVAIERNPEFAVSTICHELFGHNNFDRSISVSETLYRQAVAQQEGVAPEDVQLTEDQWSRFNYFESEIASLVWEYDLYIGSDEEGNVNPLGSPEALMVTLMQNLQSQWAPQLVTPLFQGLHRRFQVDPAISDPAAAWYAACVQNHLGITL